MYGCAYSRPWRSNGIPARPQPICASTASTSRTRRPWSMTTRPSPFRATPVRGSEMKKQYDFRHGRRGAVVRAPSGKTRITIRIDDDILQWFREQVHKAGGGSYQTLINDALRSFAESVEHNPEDALRRVVREELLRYRVQPKTGRTRR